MSEMQVGQVFTNGVDGPSSVDFRWGVKLTVVRADHGYSKRFIVRDFSGHHGLVYRGI